MKIHSLNTGLFKLDGGAMFGVVPKVLWSKHIQADEHNLCNWTTRLLLIESGKRLILIDTGLGNKQDDKFFKHYYLSNTKTLKLALSEIGFGLDQITDVILTHLHFDHCGGAVSKNNNLLEPTFKNATFWSSKQHWEWATNPNSREKASFLTENILPLQESGQLKFIDRSSTLISSSPIKNIDFIFVDGHTDAMMLPLISIKEKKILYTADLLPSTIHLPIPWVMGYDTKPLQTVKEKKIILEQAYKNNWLLFFEHDSHNEACTLKQTEKGIRVDEITSLKEYL